MALRFAMPGLAAVLLVLLCCCVSVQSQSYIPQPPAFSSCPPGQQLLTLGTTDISNSTLFPYNDEGSYLSANDYYYQYVYITPVTLRGQNAFGVTIYQMALNLLDNRAILEGPAHLRLGIFLYQEAEKTTNMFDLAALIAQTDEITLYPSADQILYANLTQPVILDSEGDYGLAIYTDSTLAVAAGDYNTGAYGLGQFAETEQQNNINYNSYNAYSIPTGVLAYPNDARRPVSATGCLDSSQFKQPNQTYYAFCSLVETYLRQPANNTSPLITSLTNVTRYSGVIAVWNNYTVKTDYGTGYRISFMEGEVQVSTNAGALVYPPLGLHATPFFYRPTSSLFPNASDLLYPDMAIPIDRSGIVITTMRNQTNLFYTGVSNDSTIGQRGEGGVIKTYFSSFDIFEGVDSLEKVITACNVPPGYDYYPTNFQCPSDAAPVSFGDIDLNDVDPVQEDTYDDKLPPNLISFRFFIAWTPNTTIYQLSYFTYANPVAIVHMRMGLFSTNTSYVDSFSALPQYQLLEQTEEIELVNVDDTMIVANLRTPVKLTQNRTYAIGVWADSLLYGPQAQWGVDAAGAPLPYNTIDQDGSFPKQILALGGQTGTQPMAAVGCVAQERLIAFQWCATFADYFEVFGQWYLDRRFYSGTFWGLSREYTNDWGTYHILTAGNGTFWEIVTPVDPPPPPQQDAWTQRSLNNTKEQQAKQTKLARLGAGRNATAIWNLNNFQVQSQDYFYTSSSNGQYFDMNGIQIIMNVEVENYEEIYAVILNSVKPRGSPEFFYQENVEFTYQDAYAPIFNSGVEMHVNLGNNAAVPTCPLINVPWDLVYIGLVEYSYPFIAVCNGLAQMESTYGDNRIAEYSDNYEGHTVKGGVVYTYNFTASAGNYIDQVSLDVLNNTAVNADYWVTAYMGIYAQNGSLLSSAIPIQMLQPLDQMMVSDLDPPFLITEDGLYYVAVFLDHDYFVAQGKGTGLSMSWSGEGGLPATFQPDGVSRTPPIAAYGCITASHYFCGSFQYYQGDDYSPVAVDYLYQGLLLTGPNNGTNANGNWVGVLDAVGHLTSYVRIARYAANFLTDWTDILLSNPGNATSNYIYTSSKTNQPMDSVGLTFYTSDEYGYEFTIYWNDTSKVWVDTSNPQLGPELLQTFTLQPIDFTVGIPQCSYLDLEQSVSPASALQPSSQCGSDTNGAVMWGDANSDDYFYTEEGFTAGYYTNITLSPFNTGNTYSNVTQLALTLGQNGNVFAHIRMALYLNATLLAESNELTVDNSQDVTLYFTLNQTVTLFPAATYYIAMWTDVSLYMAQAWDYSGLCYYGITYGYDLQPWPASIGSVEAKYVNCHAIPVAALGCAVPTGPAWVPPVDPNCPVINTTTPTCDCGSSSTGSVMPSSTSMPSMTSTPSVSSNSMPSLSSSSSSGSVVPNNCTGQGDATTESGHSTMTLIVAALVSAAAAALVTLLAVWMYTSGKCGGAASKNAAPKRRSGESSTQILSRGDSLSDNYSSLTE